MRDLVDYCMLVAHVLGAVLGIGGAAYLLLILGFARRSGQSAAAVPDADGASEPVAGLAREALARFRGLVMIATVLLLLSGGHLTFARKQLEEGYALLLLGKITVALVVFGLWHAVAARARSAGPGGAPLGMLRLALILSLLVLAAGTWISTGFAARA